MCPFSCPMNIEAQNWKWQTWAARQRWNFGEFTPGLHGDVQWDVENLGVNSSTPSFFLVGMLTHLVQEVVEVVAAYILFLPVLIFYLYVICSWSGFFSCSLNARWLSSLVPPGALARWIWGWGLSVIRHADVTWSPGMCRCFGETGHSSEG